MAKQEFPENFKHIVRVAQMDLPGEKQIRIALAILKGVGVNLADAVCALAKVQKTQRTGLLTNEEVQRLNDILKDPLQHGIPIWMANRRKDFETGKDMHLLSGALQFAQENDLKRLKKIKTLRGVRHIRGLTVRGQRTRSNFRKNKGKVVGVTKKKVVPGAAGGEKEKK
ncbi:MAG: 30S ribosomal protein S13 [Nanoarchaeota archaeon]|nr:30S ribosomal protein S13 [Nanoarchaeota archaeon]